MKLFHLKNCYRIFNPFKTYSGIKTFLVALLLIIGLGSCERFLVVDTPQTQVVGESVFNEANLANSTMGGVYMSIRETVLRSTYCAQPLGLYSDELQIVGGVQNTAIDPYYYNTISPLTTAVSFWENTYVAIYKANAILEGVSKSQKLDQKTADQLKGEALFLRALLHFNLTNLYGKVPYITSTNYIANKVASRMPEEEVFKLIFADLEEAKKLLTESYPTTERTRANKYVVSALLARAHLYKGNWEEAEKESSVLIGNELYKMEKDDLSKLFLKSSTSAILQLQSNATLNASEGATFYSTSQNVNHKTVFLSDQLLQAFEPGDKRFAKWTSLRTRAGKSVYMPCKYKETFTSAPDSKEYSIVFRIEEQFLIRAEARAHLNNFEDAQKDLNVIRNRAGLDNTTAATLPDMLTAILQERNVEFFTEMGHRWFDIKRMKQAEQILKPLKPAWDSAYLHFPISEAEILSNPNLLPQNPGY